jgi:hypothetical protein
MQLQNHFNPAFAPMNPLIPSLNLVSAWLGIVLGFGSGFLLGLQFHKEDWLGGYTSHRRRLYRLGHISFFGLAIINFLFYFTMRDMAVSRWPVTVAAWGFIVGAITMPLCCLLTAHSVKWRTSFAVPVTSLMVGGLLTLWEVTKS